MRLFQIDANIINFQSWRKLFWIKIVPFFPQCYNWVTWTFTKDECIHRYLVREKRNWKECVETNVCWYQQLWIQWYEASTNQQEECQAFWRQKSWINSKVLLLTLISLILTSSKRENRCQFWLVFKSKEERKFVFHCSNLHLTSLWRSFVILSAWFRLMKFDWEASTQKRRTFFLVIFSW